MAAIGETLRRERLKRNLELEAISRELKISHKFLEAIEDERFDKLPRGVFAKSFVRQYARLLGLDEEELAGEVQRAVEPAATAPQFAEQAPQPPPAEIRIPRVEAWQNVSDGRSSRSSSLPALAMVVVVMLVCSGVYALWQRSRRPPPPAVQVENRLPHLEPAPSQEPAKSQPALVQRPADTSSADRPLGDGAVPGTPASKTAPPQPGTQVQVPNPNPRGPVQVAVTADEVVWVLVKTDGKIAFTGALEAQQTRTFDASDSVTVRLGNAGGVSMKLNGQSIGAVGPKGQVRTVQFTSGGFQIVAPPKPSLPIEDLL